MTSTTSQQAPIPNPPDPPASFGVLGPEYELHLPVLESEILGPEVEAADVAAQEPAIFVPTRRGANNPKPAGPEVNIVGSPKLAQPPLMPPRRDPVVNPPTVLQPAAASANWSDPGATPTQFTDAVEDPWKRYLEARKVYKSIVRTAHQELERSVRGRRLSGGAGMELFEWELDTGSGIVQTAGVNARMKRGPSDTPVILEVVALNGAVTTLKFGELSRGVVKTMAAAIRKQGKIATPSAHVLHVLACRASLLAKLDQHDKSYVAAANSYAAHAQLPPIPSRLGGFSEAEYGSQVRLVRAAVGTRLKGPSRDFATLVQSPVFLSVLIAVVLVIILVLSNSP